MTGERDVRAVRAAETGTLCPECVSGNVLIKAFIHGGKKVTFHKGFLSVDSAAACGVVIYGSLCDINKELKLLPCCEAI